MPRQSLKNRMYTASREYDFAEPGSYEEKRAKRKYQHAARKLKRLTEAEEVRRLKERADAKAGINRRDD